MGKFERGKVREAELILTKLLNKNELDPMEKKHELFPCIKSLKESIKKDFPNIKKASHIGDEYNEPGNIKLVLESGKVAYVEVKFVSKGKGTRANIGQDSLTDFSLFERDTLSWSRFRESKGHEIWLMEILDRFKNYPFEYQIGTRKEVIEKKASYLKEKVLGIKTGNIGPIINQILSTPSMPTEKRLAASIINEIMERDRREKIEYIEYLNIRKQNPYNIKKFTFLILAGAHSHIALNYMWSLQLEDIINMLSAGFYRVYYVNKTTLNVGLEDLTKKLIKLINDDLRIFFKREETNVIIGFRKLEDKELVGVLRVVFHWKNIFQGIKTPCLNIFDESFLKDP